MMAHNDWITVTSRKDDRARRSRAQRISRFRGGDSRLVNGGCWDRTRGYRCNTSQSRTRAGPVGANKVRPWLSYRLKLPESGSASPKRVSNPDLPGQNKGKREFKWHSPSAKICRCEGCTVVRVDLHGPGCPVCGCSFRPCPCQVRLARHIRPSNPVEPPVSNSFAVLASDDCGSGLSGDEPEPVCSRKPKLGRLGRSAINLLEEDLGISRVKNLPRNITCGMLRPAVRSCFGSLGEIQELSVKSVQKLEHDFCTHCEEKYDGFVKEWRDNRFRPQTVRSGHLSAFAWHFSRNLEKGWNKRKYPYVPNGHATLWASRREGGNWNKESFEDWCRPSLVISSGKPRVVTLYSEHNTRVLTPLHLSLYEGISKRGWLLRGEPTNRAVNDLNGKGCFLSLDYASATDNIKTAYVRAAIGKLIEFGEGLTDDEVRCLQVLGELRLEPGGDIATRGQPMGSVVSFPLLCLINKTLQDMALTDLLYEKKITIKEWVRHRALINGDDCLTKEPLTDNVSLRRAIVAHGKQVGLIVNEEKSMSDPRKGEINSQLFVDGVRQKKTNVAALQMRTEVTDVLGFAKDSCRTLRSFRRVVVLNSRILAKQDDKWYDRLPAAFKKTAVADRRINIALRKEPASRRREKSGYLAMCRRPDGYGLSREIEVTAINDEVSDVRREVSSFRVPREKPFRTSSLLRRTSLSHLTKKRAPAPELILQCLVRRFREEKIKEMEDGKYHPGFDRARGASDRLSYEDQELGCPSTINFLTWMIRSREAPPRSCSAIPEEFISLADQFED